LRAQAARNDPEALRGAARQFESLVVQMMLKNMRAASFAGEDDPFAPSESMKLYRDLLDQQWAQRISSSGALGFADMLTKHLGGPRHEPVPAGALQGHAGAGGTALAPAHASPADALAGTVAPAQARPEPDAAPRADVDRKQRFLDAMRPHAETAERATGVPARFILAHAALESGWGEREIPRGDGGASHNLFGIKAGGGWRGDSVEATTTEYRHGLPVKQVERFRAYAGYAEGFADYAALLVRRYGHAVGAGADAEDFAKALAAGGYATDPAYAGKLRGVIASVARAGV
jgi:flagellar protein FlgJ